LSRGRKLRKPPGPFLPEKGFCRQGVIPRRFLEKTARYYSLSAKTFFGEKTTEASGSFSLRKRSLPTGSNTSRFFPKSDEDSSLPSATRIHVPPVNSCINASNWLRGARGA